MTVLREGALELRLPPGVHGRKFDSHDHGLSHCLKAVDFVIEEPDRVLFVEFKDPDHPRATPRDRREFLQKLESDAVVDELVRKYRDSFLYRWAEQAEEKPIHYLVLVAASGLDAAMLLAQTEELQRRLPVEGPPSGAWRRRIVAGCGVFNLETWNERLPRYRVTRTSS